MAVVRDGVYEIRGYIWVCCSWLSLTWAVMFLSFISQFFE